MAALSMKKQEFSRLEVRLPAEVRTLALSIAPLLVRIRIGVPPGENCGADRRAMAPSGTRGVLNDALPIYFANAFAARWCVGARAESTEGVFHVREDAEGRGGPAQYP